ncbi:Octanoyltransferase [compost metagenome]
MYVLLNLKRIKLGVRDLVTLLEQTVVNTLAEFDIDAHPRADAPGVYVGEKKICSLGLRIRKGCSFHGLALNINMDLAPFQRINPCGYAGMEMAQMCQWAENITPDIVRPHLVHAFLALLNNPPHEYMTA